MFKVVLHLAIVLSVNSLNITCRFGEIRFWLFELRYTCEVVEVQNLEIVEVTQIIGDHLSDRSHDDVEGLDWDRKIAFSAFPRGLDQFFPNLKAIDLRNNKLTSISYDDLASLYNLGYFAAHGRIESLDGDLFNNSLKLERIYFNNNLIQSVGVNLLSNLNELAEVGFENNPCINIIARSPNQIELLKEQLITQCPELETTDEPETTTTDSPTTDVTN